MDGAMTDEERNAAIGSLVVEYEENERLIATQRAILHRVGEDLTHLGIALKGYRSAIEVTGSDLTATIIRDRRSVPSTSVSFDNIRDHIGAWHKALANKERLEDCLRQAGLEKLIAK